MANDDEVLAIAYPALKELEEFEWPAFSDREGDAIAAGLKALREIIALLERRRTP